jgi:hypothetical protein
MDLTWPAFAQWLRSLPPDKAVGLAGGSYLHPFALFVSSLHGGRDTYVWCAAGSIYVWVQGDDLPWYLEEPSVVAGLPAFNDLLVPPEPLRAVTAGECVAVLDQLG